MFSVGIFRSSHFYKLDLFELMLSYQAASIFAIAARFASKARCISGVIFRQVGSVEDLTGMIICYRNLCSWNQGESALVLYMEKVLLEFRQLICSKECFAIYQKRRQRFSVAMLARVN